MGYCGCCHPHVGCLLRGGYTATKRKFIKKKRGVMEEPLFVDNPSIA
jgi:hypothetical protein